MRKTVRFAGRAALLASAGLAYVFAPSANAAAPANPCTVFDFNSCYIGVDGTDIQTLSTVDPTLYNFVGLGVRSVDVGIPPNTPFLGSPSGTLDVNAGGSITLDYLPGTIGLPTLRPADNSVLVGVSAGSSGTLNVNGGSLTTPILFVGQGDDTRPSTGTATISGGGTLSATLDTGTSGPLPGFNAVNIGRGTGSSGVVTVTGTGSTLNAPAGNISIGRGGSGTLNVLAGGQVLGSTTATTVFGSTGLTGGTTQILVDGTGGPSKITADQVLLGVGFTMIPLGSTPIPDFTSTNHGTGTLDVRNGGEVVADVFSGSGGTIQGNGTITGNVTSTGTVAPGNSPGTLHIDGDFTQTGGEIRIEIAGANVFDVIDLTGVANLTDVLIRFLFIDGYAPTAADEFAFLLAPASLTITRPTYSISGLQPGFLYDVSGANGALSLIALNNGESVPEPATLVLLGVGLAGISARRRAVRRNA